MSANYCRWLYEIGPEETEGWEYEARDLAAVSRTGVAVPPGFVVSYKVFEQLFESRSLAGNISKAGKGLSASRPERFAAAAKDIRAAVVGAEFPVEASSSLKAFYEQLRTQLLHSSDKAVRLHLTGLSDNEVTLVQSVKSGAEFEKALRQLFSLLFTEHDLFQRVQARQPLVPNSFGVLIQYLEAPVASGLAACHDQSEHDDLTIQIDAWPLTRPTKAAKETMATHDSFRVDRKSLTLLSRNLKRQWWAEDGSGKFIAPKQQPDLATALDDDQVLRLARFIKLAQAPFQSTMRFEWVYAHKQFLITRAYRMEHRADCECSLPPAPPLPPDIQPALVQGLSGALGVVSGPARLIKHKKDQAQLKPGEIAVTEHLTSQDADWLQNAAGVVTEAGTQTSPESRVAQQLLVPAVVGASKALSLIGNGQIITVDGRRGAVYKGVIPREAAYAPNQSPVTGTKIWTLVSDPYQVSGPELIASDGVGLMRGEFIIRMLGLHPHDVLRRGFAGEYSDILAEGISRVARLINPHPLVYQLHDLNSADLLGLRERHHDRHEPNPILGFRGTHRLLSEPELLEIELQALSQVADKGADHISIMLPMVRSIDEVKRMIKYLQDSPLSAHLATKVWVKCETPAMLILMEELCQLDIAGVCFEVPALTQLIQGIDRDNAQVAHHLDTTGQAVEQALTFAIATCRNAGIATMLVAELDELRPEVVQSAVKAGLTGVTVIPSFLPEMRAFLASVEQRMLLDHVLSEDVA
ncbi:MAG: putative PEP-binding protein [bacterium]